MFPEITSTSSGVTPVLGRAFLPEEDRTPDSHPVVVLSYACWQKRFAGDRAVVGRTVSFNNHPFTVIGVAPKGFVGTEVAYAPEFFVPLMMAKQIEPGSTWLDQRDSDNLFVIGRLKRDVTAAQAKSELVAITAQMAKEHPTENAGRGILLMTPGLFIPNIRDLDLRALGCSRRCRRARLVTRLRKSGQSSARACHRTAQRNRNSSRRRGESTPAR